MATLALTPAHVLAPFHKLVKSKFPKLIRSIVFDPQLTYETALSTGRVLGGLVDDVIPKSENSALPMLSWNRTNSRRASTGRTTTIITSPVSGSVVAAKVSPVEFDYNFNFFSESMQDIELFEAFWLTNTCINSIGGVEVNIPGVDSKINFAFNWDRDLSEIFFNKDTNYYKSLQGKATVSGMIVTGETSVPEEDYPRIEKVTFTLKDCEGNSLEQLEGSDSGNGDINWNFKRD